MYGGKLETRDGKYSLLTSRHINLLLREKNYLEGSERIMQLFIPFSYFLLLYDLTSRVASIFRFPSRRIKESTMC